MTDFELMINLSDQASYDSGKVPLEKKYAGYVVKSGKYEIGNTVWKEGICDENVIGKKIRSILGGIICMGGCTHIWHTLTGQMAT